MKGLQVVQFPFLAFSPPECQFSAMLVIAVTSLPQVNIKKCARGAHLSQQGREITRVKKGPKDRQLVEIKAIADLYVVTLDWLLAAKRLDTPARGLLSSSCGSK